MPYLESAASHSRISSASRSDKGGGPPILTRRCAKRLFLSVRRAVNIRTCNRTYGVIMKHAATKTGREAHFNDLVESIDDLLKRISDIDSPEVNKIRTKVQIALSAAKSAWKDTTHYANERVTNSLRWPAEQMRQ